MARGRRSVQTLAEGQFPLAGDSNDGAQIPEAEESDAQKNPRSIDDMEGAALKEYARSIGISQRDVDGLTESRLRQNCKARVFAAIEE